MAWRPDYQQHLGIRVLSPTTSPRADRHGMLSLGSATIDKFTPFDSQRPCMHTSISELSTTLKVCISVWEADMKILVIRHATLLHVLLHFHAYVMLRCCCTLVCTSTHTSCYAAARSLTIPQGTSCHAAACFFFWRIHTYVMLRCCTFSCASTHTSCHAAARFLVVPHICRATLLHVHPHFHAYVMLQTQTVFYADGCKRWKGTSKQQVPEKRFKWQNFAHNRSEFVKRLGGNPRKKILLCSEHQL